MSEVKFMGEHESGPMSRGDWKVLVSRTLIFPLSSLQVVWREAMLKGVLTPGPGGINSRPLDMRERKDFLEFLVIAMCVGSWSCPQEKFLIRNGRVSWLEDDGLVAEIRGGASTRVTIPDSCLNILLAADLS